MIGRRPLVAALLVPFGVVVSHLLAYAVAGARSGSSLAGAPPHSHLGPLVLVAAVLMAVALVASGRAGSRGERLVTSPWRLAGLQGAAFTAMEVAEYLSHGATLGHALAEPTLVLGLAVQVLVAAAACLLLWLGHVVGSRLAARPATARRRVTGRWPRDAWAIRPAPLSPVSRRGPPLVA